MPGLYGNTSTSYTVTASNVSTLYLGSTSTAITATTYSTNLPGLYGGSYSPLPTNAQQLIQLFDNNGNVQFFLDPATNSSTIAASVFQFTTATSAQLGNWIFAGNTATNALGQSFTIDTAGKSWTFGVAGQLGLPNGAQITDSTWQAAPGSQVSITNNTGTVALTVSNTGTEIQASTSTWSFNPDGSTKFPNYTFPAQHGAAGTVLTDNGAGTLYWSTATGGGGAQNQVYDFGTIQNPVSFTLDMGPITV
jgi:hypothetical protein